MLRADLSFSGGPLSLDVDLEVDAGRCLALAGPSGAGKSTVLRLLAGALAPRRGRITVGEIVWADAATGHFLAPERRRCGYVPQSYGLFPHLSAWRNVAYGLRGASRAERRAIALELLERFGLASRADARPRELSGGEQQRVALARALACRPSLLLLDEPLSALDGRSRALAGRQLGEVIASLEIPAVLVSHDFAVAAQLSDQVAIIDGGSIVQRGTATELAGAPVSAFVADFTGAVVLTGTARSDAGMTVVELDGGGRIVSADSATGHVAASVFPWEIALAPVGAISRDSVQNHLQAHVTSVVALGNRVRVGLHAGQPFAAEITRQAADDLGLVTGLPVTAGFKATATRLVCL